MTRRSYTIMVLFMIASAFLGGVVSHLLTARQAEAQLYQLTAGRFVLVDQWGAQRGVLEMTRFGGAQLTVDGFYGETPRASISVQPSGSTGVDLRDAGGRVRASLALSPEGRPTLAMMDEYGRVIWSAP